MDVLDEERDAILLIQAIRAVDDKKEPGYPPLQGHPLLHMGDESSKAWANSLYALLKTVRTSSLTFEPTWKER